MAKFFSQLRAAMNGRKATSRPLFSIIHPSARPSQWRAVYDAWMKAAVNPEDVEYVLCVDERWGFDKEEYGPKGWDARGVKAVWNTGRRCYVDAVNTAAKASTGRILIVIADDQFPCDGWDAMLFKAAFDPLEIGGPGVEATLSRGDFVIEVSTGTPQEHERGIMPMPILSRARYERLGYIFFPEYESMYADNDFCEHARHDGVVIDARHLMFPHKHPLFDDKGQWAKREQVEAGWDAAYAAQNSSAAYTLGESILKRRRAVQFDGIAPEEKSSSAPIIAVCLPGETFSSHVMAAWTELYTHLLRTFSAGVAPCFDHYSNVYFTRQALGEAALLASPDYILWFDDDQVIRPADFDLLFDRLKALDADVVAGWTWIPGDKDHPPQVSCGKFSEDDKMVTFVPRQEMERVQSLGAAIEVEWTGFPVVLMKASALRRANDEAIRNQMSSAFMPVHTPMSRFSVSGEDIAFSVFSKRAGCKIYVDARVFVEHLKLQPVRPPVKQDLEVKMPYSAKAEAERTLEYTGV